MRTRANGRLSHFPCRVLLLGSILALASCDSGSKKDPPPTPTPDPKPDPSPALEATFTQLLNGKEASTPPGPELSTRDLVEQAFTIDNTGDLALQNAVVETQDGELLCTIDSVPPGESASCTYSFLAALGEQSIATVVNADAEDDLTFTAESTAYYTGVNPAALSAIIRASRTAGDAPLEVLFSPDAITDAAIFQYDWDFDGDGTFDRMDQVGRQQRFVYSEPGEYNVQLQVTEQSGETQTATILIRVGNTPPSLAPEANPSNGGIPLTVTFAANARDPDGIATWEWDFDGDGTFETESDRDSIQYDYTEPGTYNASVRVTDNAGATATAQIPTLTVRVMAAGAPTITLTPAELSGRAPQTTTLRAALAGADELSIEAYAWDLDGDGTADQTTTEPSLAYTFEQIGTSYPQVSAIVDDESVATDSARVTIEPVPALALDSDTVDPDSGDAITITADIGGAATTSVQIIDAAGNVVRTLAASDNRPAEVLTLSWDGRDDSGAPVAEGVYSVLFNYELDGQTRVYDLRESTGGQEFQVSRTSIPTTFRPFAGEPLRIDFTLPQAAEVTAFMGLESRNVRLVTFLQRETFGRGTHTIVWNGESDDGQLIERPEGVRFLYGMFGYRLADNQMYVSSGTNASNVLVTPTILQPLSELTEQSTAAISFDLNRPGGARVVVDDADTGARVAEFFHDGLAAGPNSVPWNGLDNNGERLAAGPYRIGVAGVSPRGRQSLYVYSLMQLFY